MSTESLTSLAARSAQRLLPRIFVNERRRWPRQPVGWSLTISVEDGPKLAAQAVDASRHGLRVRVGQSRGSNAIREGARCQVEVHLAGGQARFLRAGEIRHMGEHGIGILILKPLPIVASTDASVTVGADSVPCGLPPASSITSRLRSVASLSIVR